MIIHAAILQTIERLAAKESAISAVKQAVDKQIELARDLWERMDVMGRLVSKEDINYSTLYKEYLDKGRASAENVIKILRENNISILDPKIRKELNEMWTAERSAATVNDDAALRVLQYMVDFTTPAAGVNENADVEAMQTKIKTSLNAPSMALIGITSMAYGFMARKAFVEPPIPAGFSIVPADKVVIDTDWALDVKEYESGAAVKWIQFSDPRYSMFIGRPVKSFSLVINAPFDKGDPNEPSELPSRSAGFGAGSEPNIDLTAMDAPGIGMYIDDLWARYDAEPKKYKIANILNALRLVGLPNLMHLGNITEKQMDDLMSKIEARGSKALYPESETPVNPGDVSPIATKPRRRCAWCDPKHDIDTGEIIPPGTKGCSDGMCDKWDYDEATNKIVRVDGPAK